MGALPPDGWTVPERYIPEGKDSYRCPQNVTFPVVEGATYTFSPVMQLTVTNGDYSWEPTLGDDYTVAYADAEGNALDSAPTEAGTYKVKFTGNSDKAAQTVWGESGWITYKIDPDISKAELSYDADATTFRYNAKGQAPDIKVTFDGIELTQGDQYQVTYFSADGTVSLDKPSAPGSYRALVISLPPAAGVVGIVPFTIEPVEIASAKATNIAAGTAGAPTVAAYDASGAVIDPDAYTVSYKGSGGNVVEASALATVGSYTAVATGDGAGCTGSANDAFTVVDGGKTISSASQTAELRYTGSTLTPAFEVKDKDGNTVDAKNYDVSIVTKSESGEGEAVIEVVAAGAYTATFAAKGDAYVGQATCDFTVAAAEPEASAVTVTFNRSEYDYIPSVYWADEGATYTTGQKVIHRGEAIEPDVTVTYDGKTLAQGVDYELACANNTGTDEDFNSKGDVTEATFSVKLTGDYGGELKSDNYKYTIKKRAHSYTYKGIKFAFAVDNDGNAVITGLDMDMDATTSDFSTAYDRAAWDGETFAVPATVTEGDKSYAVKRIAGGAFQAPPRLIGENPTSDARDVLNESKTLVIEEGIEEIGQSAFNCKNIESISLPQGLKSLRAGCLWGGLIKTTEITIPATVNAMGDCVFGQNMDKASVEKVEFAQPSQLALTGEQVESSGGTSENGYYHRTQQGSPFDGGKREKQGSDNYGYAPITEIIVPASITANASLFAGFGHLENAYCMAGTYTDARIPGDTGGAKSTLWNWDTEGNPYPGAIEAVIGTPSWSYKPFAVLGDGYTYKNALNPKTGVCDAEATYPGNVQVGTPVVTNTGYSVSVDWDLQENFVNSKYAWTPAEGEDFTVSYVDDDGDAIESITQPGTYTATLTGNGKTCYGTTTATVTVGAAAIENSGVKLESTSLTYNGAAQEPAVTVELADGARLAAGTDYDVSYANNRTVGTGIVTVTGKGLYAGSVASAEFAITPATLTVTGVNASKTYGGSDPTLKCTISGLAGDDKARGYEVSREAGENPGDYAVTPTGVFVFDADGNYATGNYNVKYVDGTFTVNKIAIAAPTAKSGLVYNGAAQTGVAAGVGYTVTGGSATDAGSHTAIATLDENYVWSDGSNEPKNISWSIGKATIAPPVAKSGLVYNGAAQTGVAAGTGYTVTGGSATNAGSFTATAKASANYQFTGGKSTVSIGWGVARADLSTAAVTLDKASSVYTGKSQTSAVKAVKVGSRTLAVSDFTASPASGKDVGTYSATVTGKGNYTGTAKGSFKITQAGNSAKAAKTSVSTTKKASALKKKAAKVALPKVTAKFGTAAWKVSAKDKKGVLTLKSGKVQIKKGAKAGKYTLKLKASVAATKNYKAAATKVVTVKVTVKK